jgi:hypothetical protein
VAETNGRTALFRDRFATAGNQFRSRQSVWRLQAVIETAGFLETRLGKSEQNQPISLHTSFANMFYLIAFVRTPLQNQLVIRAV